MKPNKSYALSISKYAFSIAVATLPLQAMAVDFTPDSDRILSDPLYLPLEGQVFGQSIYNYTRSTEDVYQTSTGAKRYSAVGAGNTINQQIYYGVTNDFTLGISESYGWTKTDETAPAGAETGLKVDGFTDPTFTAIWRVLDQKEFPVTLDLRAGYSPNWVPRDSASATATGSEGLGGQAGIFSAGLGYETKSFTIEAIAGATYYDSRDSLSLYNNQTTTTDSYWNYNIGLNTQARFTDQIALNLEVIEDFNNSYTSTNETSLISAESKPGDSTAFSADLNYTLIPNQLVAGLTYSYVIYGDTTSSYASVASNSRIKNESSNVFGAQLQYAY